MQLGLLTIYSVPNFGSVLQAYATQYVIEQMGHECKMVRYRYPNELQRIVKPNLKMRLYTLTAKFGLLPQQRKSRKLKEFREKFFNFTQPYNSYAELNSENWDAYDGFIIGSDQVWNARYTKGEPAFLLSFVPESKKRFSIASSFATDELAEDYKGMFKTDLEKFDAISVREAEGINIISEQLGIDKNVHVCLDPTLLLSRNQWLSLLAQHVSVPRIPYILYYMWSYAFEPRPYINEVVKYFKEKTGISTVIALEGAPKTPIDGVRYENREDSSISDFLELFANASLVITSSFHGTAFAVNMNVPLISIIPDSEKDSRQSNLLRAVGAENSIVRLGQPFDSINPYYDEKVVSDNLEQLRKKDLDWIRSNIK